MWETLVTSRLNANRRVALSALALVVLLGLLATCDAGGLLIVEDLDGGAEVDAGEDAGVGP